VQQIRVVAAAVLVLANLVQVLVVLALLLLPIQPILDQRHQQLELILIPLPAVIMFTHSLVRET
jgi:hypothetical protein